MGKDIQVERNLTLISLGLHCRNQFRLVGRVAEGLGNALGQEEPLEEVMATHSSILAWRIPWTEEPGGLQSMGSQRVGHD